MALIKNTNTIGGYIAEYWRITSFEVLIDKRTVYVRWALYKDRETRALNVNAIADTKIEKLTDLALLADLKNNKNPLAVLYTYAKANTLTGATDELDNPPAPETETN